MTRFDEFGYAAMTEAQYWLMQAASAPFGQFVTTQDTIAAQP